MLRLNLRASGPLIQKYTQSYINIMKRATSTAADQAARKRRQQPSRKSGAESEATSTSPTKPAATTTTTTPATTTTSTDEIGYNFPNGCRITHGTGAIVKKPFEVMMPSLVMSSWTIKSAKQFSGQLGFIEFDTDIRLPRHIHMDLERKKLVDERIMVIGGVGVVEVCGKIYVVAPGSLVDAVGGVPHTWSACPAGVKLPDGTVSTGKFTMVFEYEDETKFFPTESTEPITDIADYDEYTGDLEKIRFPKLTAQDVVDQAEIIFNKEKTKVELA